jgi:MoaA/NifB/PqqE/SkfB family radical SAM enzyme
MLKEEGNTLFIFVTNNCNLKCAGCMQSCDRIKDPYYIDLNELKEYLLEIKKRDLTVNGAPIGTIHLTGGDPLTHPKFIDLCVLVKQILPNYNLDVSTNGLFLKKMRDQQLIYLRDYCNITF